MKAALSTNLWQLVCSKTMKAFFKRKKFLPLGPKNYGYKVKDPRTGKVVDCITKVKGFCLNYSNAAHINFSRLKRQAVKFIKEDEIDEITIYQPNIRRTKDYRIVSEIQRKKHKLVYSKRRIMKPTFETRPFGY